MNAVVQMLDHAPRSLVEERVIRPPTIGKIRPGIKVLTRAHQANDKAVKLYHDMVAAGESFEAIGKVLETSLKLRNALVPKNVPYFVCRRSDFANPDTADEILKLYGEDRGQGRKLYRFPVIFAFDDWLRNVPNQMAAYTSSGRQYFPSMTATESAIASCTRQSSATLAHKRVRRSFGGRLVVHRQDNDIPDGVCDPHLCPQYQDRKCNLTATFVFAIHEVKGLGLIELPTNSIYVLQKAYSAMQTVSLARGRLTGTRFWMSKKEFEITRIDDNGQPVRQKQMLTVLDADIDLGALLDGAEQAHPALEAVTRAVALVQSDTTSQALKQGTLQSEGDIGDAERSMGNDDGVRHDPNESLEDKRQRLSDLLHRLGLNLPARQNGFRIYAHHT